MEGSVRASHHVTQEDAAGTPVGSRTPEVNRAPESERALGDLGMVVQDLARTLTNLDMGHNSEIIKLTPVESMVMNQIDATPGITPRQIADALELKSSNAAAALRNLETHGFFTRVPDPHDGRVSHLHPTAVAQQNLSRVKQAWAEALAPAFPDTIDPTALVAHLTSLRDGLRRIGH
ncbi:MAG: MarR family winged helix-turn-helix transcriptional regulator [Galactobacter sp.]